MTAPAPSTVSGQTSPQVKNIAIHENPEPETNTNIGIVPTNEPPLHEETQTTQLGEEIPPAEDGGTSIWPRRMSDIRRVKPIDSWVVPVCINGVATHALIDTGAGCCLLSKAVCEGMPKSRYPLTHRPRDLHAVGGLSLQTIGDLLCDVVVNGKHDWVYPGHGFPAGA